MKEEWQEHILPVISLEITQDGTEYVDLLLCKKGPVAGSFLPWNSLWFF